jgi:hypothetical protein
MEWDMRESTSHRERRIVVCTLGSGAGLRVASSFGRNGVSSSILSFSVLEGNRDINGWGDGEGCEFLKAQSRVQSPSLYYLPRIQLRHFLMNMDRTFGLREGLGQTDSESCRPSPP